MVTKGERGKEWGKNDRHTQWSRNRIEATNKPSQLWSAAFDNVSKAMLRGKVVISTNGARTGAHPRGNTSV